MRLQLAENGYTPLPNVFKRPGIPGWQKVEADHDTIISWDRQHLTLTTGIILRDGLIAFDFDIDDPCMPTLADALLDAFPALRGAMIRTGGGHKEAWFIRCDEPFSRIATPVFRDRHVEEKGVMLEVFGGASPRQFGAFGPHSDGVEYDWLQVWQEVEELDAGVDASPRNTPLTDLPSIPKSMVFEVVDHVTRWLEDEGFEMVSDDNAGESTSRHEYVLDESMVFNVDGYANEAKTLEELRDLVEQGTSCAMDWLDGPIAKNRNRGLVTLDSHGGVCVHDTMTAVSYHELRHAPVDLSGSDTLREAMAALRQERGEPSGGVRTEQSVEARAGELLEGYAYMPSRDLAVRLTGDDPQRGQLPMKGFRTANARWARRLTEDERPTSVSGSLVNPVDFWVVHEELVMIDGVTYHPALPFPLCEDKDGNLLRNYFRPPSFDPEAAPDPGPFEEFVKRLIPDEAERSWMLDAIAYKAFNPAVPTPAVLLVDEQGGVGKGLLFDVLIRLAGERNAGLLPQSAVFGGSNMAGFKGDWGARVLHCIEELPSVAEATAKEQHQMYNRLKELVDPRPRMELMPVKYGKPVEVYTCATYWMATNHVDAIPIPANDRRIVVLTCGDRRSASYYQGFADWARAPGSMDGVFAWLGLRDLSTFNPTVAPDTVAKSDMISATRYGTEVAVRDWMENIVDAIGAPPAYVTTQMVLHAVRSTDPVAFAGQSGTRRVNTALRLIGYRDPLETGSRTATRIRVRHASSGEGIREHLLQLSTSRHRLDVDVTREGVTTYVRALTKVSKGLEKHTFEELERRLTIRVVET